MCLILVFTRITYYRQHENNNKTDKDVYVNMVIIDYDHTTPSMRIQIT